ncbi:hypothetical protein Rsub_06003 [Raphidocelis subcapitata]|uniref:Uncharacterized protein n=1 Tax=Raphidocelis subcapitata TaxID=307507 RepID=A0A2V0P067_9CHLO|nr:hypothetical protein Rsub_06003 [Raphidocelis subcapitata]|eukprot:GBF93271.1 hypothetical protein Rsub_06003 [Raphidocelis subcapitata]
MVGVCCGCIAQPASVQPRKTYNSLVGSLFAGEAIKTGDPLDSTLRRKIQKLQEYIQKNPGKIPKVSRRLMRRVRATLRAPGDNLGHVKVAVLALVHMLAMSADEESSYSASFFARELVTGPDAVVPLLLRDPHIEVRTLGAELLSAFTRVQPEAESRLDAIQALVPLTCRAARAALHAETADQKVARAASRRRAGDALALPNPLDLIARRAPAHVAALEAACLRCLCEVVSLAARNKVAPEHLEEMQAVALDNLRRTAAAEDAAAAAAAAAVPSAAGLVAASLAAAPAAGGDGGSARAGSAAGGGSAPGAGAGAGAAAPPGVVDPEFYSAMGVAHRLPPVCGAGDAAARLLQLLAGFVRDISTVYEVMGTFYRYMDGKQRWGEDRIVQAFMAALAGSGTRHEFPIYSSLLRHASSGALAPRDCAAVVSVTAQQARRLGAAHAMPALAAALQELPRVYSAQARAAADAAAEDAAGGGGGGGGGDGDGGDGSAAGGGGGAGAGADPLREAVLGLVCQLAAGVGAAAELSEALTLALRAAAEDARAGDPVAALMGADAAAAAASAWRAGGSAGGGEPPREALPGGVLPPSLVAAVLAACEAAPPALRWPLLRVPAHLLPTALNGLRTDKQAAALAGAVCAALLSPDPAVWESATLPDVAAADRLLRACLAGGAPRPATELALGRWLLHAAQDWGGRGGYAAAGGGDAVRAAAVMQVASAAVRQLAALPGGAGSALPQLPIAVGGAAGLSATPEGIVAALPAFPTDSAPACAAALAALEEQQPPLAWAQAARAALAAAPGLLAELGEQRLGEALDLPPAEEEPRLLVGAGPDGKQPFSDRVQHALAKRMMTLRRDLAHVSELMRDSIAPRPSETGGGPALAGPHAPAVAAGGGGWAAGGGGAAAADAGLLGALPEELGPAAGGDPFGAAALPSAAAWAADAAAPPPRGGKGAAAAAAGGLDAAGVEAVLRQANGAGDVRIGAAAGEPEPARAGW